MAVLHAAQRNALPSSAFAGPDRTFPIEDKTHAVQAMRFAHDAPNPSAIRSAVHQKFPGVGDKKAAVHAKLQDMLMAGAK